MNRLKELRQEKKLTQKELADLIDVHYRTLQNWENGESQIKPEKAEKLANFFGVSIAYLLGYSDFSDVEELKKIPIFQDETEKDYLIKLLTEIVENATVKKGFSFTDFNNFIDELYLSDYPENSATPIEIIQIDKEDFFKGLLNAPIEVQELIFNWSALKKSNRKQLLKLIKSIVGD